VNSVDVFEQHLSEIPWLRSLGMPLEPSVPRIRSWEDWPGEDVGLVDALGEWQQSLHDRIIAEAGAYGDVLEDAFVRIRDKVVNLAKGAVSYASKGAIGHVPTHAVWGAAWTAGLVALCLATGRNMPAALDVQWEWYRKGHWPGALDGFPASGDVGNYRKFRVY
jgi:hypothetical protein